MHYSVYTGYKALDDAADHQTAESSKLMAVMQPEINAIQKKYKGKENDQKSAMMMQAEMKAVYEKYGTSMTGGCLPLAIQMPINFRFVPCYL